jgi:CheY-like chemotaxis protein
MRPVGASSGTDALAKLKHEATSSDPFALAILDMQMPAMDGLNLARAIKESPDIADTRLLLMTSLGPRCDTAVLRAAGVGAFLVKPVKQAQLIDCVLNVMSATAPCETRFWHQRKPVASPSATELSLSGLPPLHILVAEDNPINQKVAIGLLEKLGSRAVAAATGKEVLTALELVPYDIIFMDCQLPELDGFKTTREIRKRESNQSNGSRQRAHIIAMTSYAVSGAREKCIEAGMDDYISKPIQLDTLGKVLQRAMDSIRCLVAPAPTITGAIIDPSAIDVLRQLRRPDKPDPVIELIDMFIRDTPERLHKLRTAVAQYNAEELAAVAHNLRGCASSIGATQLANLCQKLEENAERRAMQVSTPLIKEIESEFDRVCHALAIERAKTEQLV